MPDTDNDQQNDPGRLRKDNDKLRAELRQMQSKLALVESGYGHLTDKQRNAVIRDMDDDKLDLTAENFAKAAKGLGYEPPKDNGQNTNSDDGNDGNDNSQQTDGQNGEGQPFQADPRALEAMQTMIGANNAMGTGQQGDTRMSQEEFWRKFNELKASDNENGDRSMEFIRQHGAVVGLGDSAVAD